jgi:LPXTG-site transpeptidase (sortase) family protein
VAEQISTDDFSVPVLSASGAILSTVPEETQSAQASTVSRIVIPSINVDSKTIEVGWEIQEQDGQQVAVWQVAEYAVGHHKGSANPGEGGNIVLAGHVGGYGLVFRDLFYVQPGDDVLLYTQDQQHRYIVQERLVLDEVGVSAEQRAANARYIEPTDEEMVTLVTCWPASGPERFTQRIIVRATPAEIIQNNMPDGVR